MIVRIQIRRNLNVHSSTQNEPCCRNRACDLDGVGLCATCHSRAGFCAEILNDDFLNMTVGFVEISNRKQAVNALFASFTDSDQDARRERNRKLARLADHA